MIIGHELTQRLHLLRTRFGKGKTRRALPAVLGGYTSRVSTGIRAGAKIMLAFVALFYGLAIGLTGTNFVLQLLMPLAAVAFLIIWLLPDTENSSHRVVEALLFAYLGGTMIWPDYLAIALPGLPWITMGRIFALPLAIIYLASLSQSSKYRAEITSIMHEIPVLWKSISVFIAISACSILFSSTPFESVNRFFYVMYGWVLIFFAASHVFKFPGRATLFCYLVWISAIMICAVTFFEVRKQAVPWAGHIPSFLKVEDEAVQRMLSPKVRVNTGAFRAQSKFASPLSMAEFMALCAPFVMHVAFYHRKLIIRIAAFATLPCIVWATIKTDARLGMVGLFIGSLLFVLAWAIKNVRNDSSSLLARIVLFGYPLGFAAILTASLTITRFKNAIWGSSAYNNSNQARIDQLNEGIPKIMSQPWGHGIGRGGAELGYSTSSGILTIDNYILTIAIELGVFGLIAFLLIFISTIFYSFHEMKKSVSFEESLLIPATICLINFVIIKFVLSQMENNTLFFAILGLSAALIYRLRIKNSRLSRISRAGI